MNWETTWVLPQFLPADFEQAAALHDRPIRALGQRSHDPRLGYAKVLRREVRLREGGILPDEDTIRRRLPVKVRREGWHLRFLWPRNHRQDSDPLTSRSYDSRARE